MASPLLDPLRTCATAGAPAGHVDSPWLGPTTAEIHHGDEDEDDGALGGGMGDQGKPLDLREMPRYQAPVLSAGEVIAPTLPDLGLLAVLVTGCFAVAFTAFLRYDVRPG